MLSPNVPPTPPTGLTASTGSGRVTVTWTAPISNGGSPITGYTLSDGPDQCTTTGSLSCTVTGLSNGQTYLFSVTATNAAGISAPSDPVTVSPAGAPDAPGDLKASQAPGQTVLSWNLPLSSGGSAITGYRADDGKGHTCLSSTQRSCTVTGLTNGTTYTFTVTATSALGTSPASSPVSVTPGGPPGAPQDLAAKAQDGQLSLSWTAPTITGGLPITGYRVDDGKGRSCTTTGDLACTVTGLTNGTAYTFTVTATNLAGSSPASSAVTGTPKGVPSTPTSVSATAGDRQVVVTWAASNANGSNISGYKVDDGQGHKCTTTGATSCTVTGLTNGTTYSFSVVATNAIGSSAPSGLASATPAVAPGAPTNLVAQVSSTQAQLSWTAPTSNGGAAITQYKVDDGQGHTCTTTGATTCIVTGLTNGSTYTFTVVARNSAGTSAASSPVTANPVGPPPAPTGLKAKSADGQLTFKWVAPASTGGAPITGYRVDDGAGHSCTSSGELTCTITGRVNGVASTYTVTATNSYGTSAPSASVVGTAASPPGAPTGVTLTPSDGALVIQWRAPASNGGSAITQYIASTAEASGVCIDSSGQLRCVLQGLTNAMAYTVTVVAYNAAGASPPSAPVTGKPIGPPTSVRGVAATAGDGSVTVSWRAPSSDGGRPIIGYKVDDFAGHRCTTTGELSCTVTGLTNGRTYIFYVVASNDKGSSAGVATSGTVPRKAAQSPHRLPRAARTHGGVHHHR